MWNQLIKGYFIDVFDWLINYKTIKKPKNNIVQGFLSFFQSVCEIIGTQQNRNSIKDYPPFKWFPVIPSTSLYY